MNPRPSPPGPRRSRAGWPRRLAWLIPLAALVLTAIQLLKGG